MQAAVVRVGQPEFLLVRRQSNAVTRTAMPFRRSFLETLHFDTVQHFAGRQVTDFKSKQVIYVNKAKRPASIVWKPPGAHQFSGRRAWEGQVAYLSQFGTCVDRAHLGKAKIKAKLLGDSDPNEWDLPPRPRGMREETYERLVSRFDAYQSQLDRGWNGLAARFIEA